ncbi:MAG: hypothetical protein M9934_08720 [Thermomicrobiales bacterium]|nr:hypothetical protein [Thermomicrobiales bacterium]MCO5228354.1 hypothetical protein [Thermomicrobiales bacterium]
MTDVMLNSFLVLLTIFFGAMALYPLFISDTDTELEMESGGEDRVISVVPLDLDRETPTPLVPRSGDEHPGHQPAA